jgi:hypothetical protein
MTQPLTQDELVDLISRYEEQGLNEADAVRLFQHLIDTGMAWGLQGFYGRAAIHYIESGLCTPPPAKE